MTSEPVIDNERVNEPVDNESVIEHIIVFLDSGLQKTFIPLRIPVNFTDLGEYTPESLQEALKKIKSFEGKIPPATLKDIFDQNPDNRKSKQDWQSVTPYLKVRFGKKTWHVNRSLQTSLDGIWFLIDTNTSGQDANKGPRRYDRGYFYQTNDFTEEEKTNIIVAHKSNTPPPQGQTHYIRLKETDHEPIRIHHHGQELDFGLLSFELDIRAPGGKIRDVDVILDLGNTRTAGLLFDHSSTENEVFPPAEFKRLFKVLRLKPDPTSGEYDDLDDVESGIAQSWLVLHQLEHQKYLRPEDSKHPALLETEFADVKVTPISRDFLSKLLRKEPEYEVSGRVLQRIPQMFAQLSPVLLGDQAEREFNLPYAKALISVGAKLQQSSPKRYYWDAQPGDVWWSMLLNEWDEARDEKPRNARSLPTLQGEMLRFIREDGDVDLKVTPAKAPQAYPEHPAYPRRSTLTWFLLHILERAYSQINSAFKKGADFIPHRLRKVLITYPSGWTNDEVKEYCERCKEALDIFSQTNIYKGVESSERLEMVDRSKTPDEAVAGQLPFVFSEIIRYPGQTAAKWISLVGKKRQGTDTIRIMNFDIGGGTSDISVVEYKDSNEGNGVSQNILSTCLLFKDGQSIAGDDLVKRIIEKIILGGLIRNSSGVDPELKLKERIVNRFTQAFTNKEDVAVRSRVIQTCLIPLATKCLVSSREGNSVEFSVEDAGVEKNNWEEFNEFIGIPEDTIPFTQAFSFSSEELNTLIEEQLSGLFQNCAMYAAAYDVDLLIFSGKPSELPYIETMAKTYIPIDDSRIIFARNFKPGEWYPFTDEKGYVKDAKTVTVVGSALYYALSNGLISGWTITTAQKEPERNEWGELDAMKGPEREIFLRKDEDEKEISILPNKILARRQNRCSSPEPVYKFTQPKGSPVNNTFRVRLKRKITEDGESLDMVAVDSSAEKVKDFELKVWPCEDSSGIAFWQEKGIFDNLD